MRQRISRTLALACTLALVVLLLGQSEAGAASHQVPLELGEHLNFMMPTRAVPVGLVTWAGTSYLLDSRVFHSQDAALGWYPQEMSVDVPSEARQAQSVHLLINLDASSSDFDGDKVGEVELTWGNGAVQTVDLVAGVNVRGWLLAGSGGGLSDAGSREVYRGADVYGRTAVIDSFTVSADPRVSGSGLARITVRDTSFDTAGSLDPGIVVRAITVATP